MPPKNVCPSTIVDATSIETYGRLEVGGGQMPQLTPKLVRRLHTHHGAVGPAFVVTDEQTRDLPHWKFPFTLDSWALSPTEQQGTVDHAGTCCRKALEVFRKNAPLCHPRGRPFTIVSNRENMAEPLRELLRDRALDSISVQLVAFASRLTPGMRELVEDFARSRLRLIDLPVDVWQLSPA